MILNCDFCHTVHQVKNRHHGIDIGWNWQEGVVNDEHFTVAACPDCPVEKVKELYEKKAEALEIKAEPGEEMEMPRDEEGLEVYMK